MLQGGKRVIEATCSLLTSQRNPAFLTTDTHQHLMLYVYIATCTVLLISKRPILYGMPQLIDTMCCLLKLLKEFY